MTPNPSIWTAQNAYALGDFVEPPPGLETGYMYRCTVAGQSAIAPPAFPSSLQDTIVEAGGLTWICAGLAPIFSADDLIRALSLPTAIGALDDDRDGQPDPYIVNEIRFDATSYVLGAIGGVYAFPLDSPIPNELKRLGLSAARAIVGERSPMVMKLNVKDLYERIDRQLDGVRKAIRQLEIPLVSALTNKASPEPLPKNVGGTVSSGNPASPTPRPKYFVDGMGDF